MFKANCGARKRWRGLHQSFLQCFGISGELVGRCKTRYRCWVAWSLSLRMAFSSARLVTGSHFLQNTYNQSSPSSSIESLISIKRNTVFASRGISLPWNPSGYATFGRLGEEKTLMIVRYDKQVLRRAYSSFHTP